MFNRKKAQPIHFGSCLVAKPFWGQSDYARSVILIVEHSEIGSVGIMVNKESTLTIDQALREWGLGKNRVLYGGGRMKKSIVFLHDQPTIPDSIPVVDNIYVGGDYDAMKEMAIQHTINPDKIKYVAGSISWGAGQLEAEIRADKWWLTEITAEEYFNVDPDKLWGLKLRHDNHVYAMLEDYQDPSLN